jgi:hypothetical protein
VKHGEAQDRLLARLGRRGWIRVAATYACRGVAGHQALASAA